MGSRMDKYNINDDIPKRSDKNQELYKQIYNAYDEFENLIVPSNTREINLSDLKREVSLVDDYRKVRDSSNITNNKVIRKEVVREEQKKENEIYDINELLDKAVSSNKNDDEIVNTLSNKDYLKKLNLDNVEGNNDFSDISLDVREEEDNSLLQTANLSLEILSDLKSDNENTSVSDPIALDDNYIDDEYSFDNEELDIDNGDEEEEDFYTEKRKFKKDDFDDEESDEIDEDDEMEEESGGKTFLKTFLLVFGIVLVISVVIYLISYFGRS